MMHTFYKGYRIDIEQDGMGWWCWTASLEEDIMRWNDPYDSPEDAFNCAKRIIDKAETRRALEEEGKP